MKIGRDSTEGEIVTVIVVGDARVVFADCRDVLKTLADCSVDSVVTDPPYELGFMGKKWDSSGIAYDVSVWEECLRVLKPGGHVLAFGGSRTFHRMAVAIEDAGFEIRDSIAWMYGSGFPKSLDVSKAIDKKLGAEREVVGYYTVGGNALTPLKEKGGTFGVGVASSPSGQLPITSAGSDEGKQWEGWGTALKPAFEPIVVGRKPFAKGSTVAANVLEHGVGGLNIDASRIGRANGDVSSAGNRTATFGAEETQSGGDGSGGWSQDSGGRWPANVILDEYSAGLLDEQSGVQKDGIATSKPNPGPGLYNGGWKAMGDIQHGFGGSGGASRFFYCAKASKRDRNEGVNLCKCDKLTAWENAEPKASHQPDTDHLAPRVISESGTTSNTDTGWNTSSSGKSTTAPSSETTKSTTLTGISSTTTSGTSLTSTPLATNVFTRDVNSEMENGGSPARFAKISSQSEPNIGISAERAGFSTGDADPATSASLSSPNKSGEKLCANCGGVTVGHPTVKPTALMRYLIKLVTPPGGTVLDPFTGSGSTGKAALLDGYNFVGAEFTEEYLPIIEGRLRWAYEQEADDETLF